ncbi:MAG TPA: hypothetical protein VF179_22180 [Thermoanaerobaculia bacterium]|nr:hypothetical protein [Thermoanaerobaculia bacterium]
MEFDDGVARLVDLLAKLEWPTEIVWVRPDQVLYRPLRATIVFRPMPDAEAQAIARDVFHQNYGVAPAISFYAPAHDGTRTFAYVEAIQELADGEQMFVNEGLKIATQGATAPTSVTNSSLWWWLYRIQAIVMDML